MKQHVQKVQDANVEAPATPRQARKKRGPDVGQLASEMTGWFKQWQRYSVGYNTLNQAHASHTGQLSEGERKRGLPIFVTHASSFAECDSPERPEKVEIVCDLKQVDPQYVPHVLVPLIQAQALGMMDALLQIEYLVATIKPMLVQITGIDPEQLANEEPEGDDNEDAS